MEVLARQTTPLNTPAIPSERTSLPTVSSSWCKTCFNLSESIVLENETLSDTGYSSRPSLDHLYGGGCYISLKIWLLRKSAATGCVLCKFLERTLDTFKPENDGNNYLRIELRKSGVRYILFRSRYVEYGVDIYRLAGSVSEGSESVYGYIPARRHIGLPNSEQSMNYLKSCLKTCTENHDLCRQDPLAPRPKRLLDVGSVEEGVVKLHETSGDFREPYVALSYCWGKAKFLKTTREDIQILKQGFSLTELPESIRDAIHIVRELGLRYLWVDSLCIVQPDDEDMTDWLEQSAKMCSIYEEAYLTIAASSASSAYESFLQHSSRPRYFEYDIAGVPGLTLVARIQCQTGHHYRQWMRNPTPIDPIDERGWVLQENLLSTRMISYSTDELQWRCKTTGTSGCELISICECREFFNFKQPPIISAGQSELEILALWDEAVAMYSRRRLTNQNDKFPALSGICDLVERRTGWQYVAGMWKEYFFRLLLWSAVEGMYSPLPSESVAPSFSWASLDCAVDPLKPRKGYFQEQAQLIDLVVLPLDDNPFGRIRPGSSLKLKGKLIRNVEIEDILVQDPDRYMLQYNWGDEEIRLLLVEDSQLESFDFVDSNGLPQRSLRRSRNHFDQRLETVKVGSMVSLLLLLSHLEPYNGMVRKTYYMLVLGVSPTNHDAFERLGQCGANYSIGKVFDDLESEEILIY